jgi:hypothetical protein
MRKNESRGWLALGLAVALILGCQKEPPSTGTPSVGAEQISKYDPAPSRPVAKPVASVPIPSAAEIDQLAAWQLPVLPDLWQEPNIPNHFFDLTAEDTRNTATLIEYFTRHSDNPSKIVVMNILPERTRPNPDLANYTPLPESKEISAFYNSEQGIKFTVWGPIGKAQKLEALGNYLRPYTNIFDEIGSASETRLFQEEGIALISLAGDAPVLIHELLHGFYFQTVWRWDSSYNKQFLAQAREVERKLQQLDAIQKTYPTAVNSLDLTSIALAAVFYRFVHDSSRNTEELICHQQTYSILEKIKAPNHLMVRQLKAVDSYVTDLHISTIRVLEMVAITNNLLKATRPSVLNIDKWTNLKEKLQAVFAYVMNLIENTEKYEDWHKQTVQQRSTALP